MLTGDAPLGGTTFTLRLAAGAARKPPAQARRAPEKAETVRPLEILVVEDEASIRLLVARFLVRLGHAVETAENGRAALDTLGNREFDVVLTDLKMPEMDGEELYRRLCEMKPGMAARVLFVSGDTVAERTREFLAGSGRPFIDKPFDLNDLAERVALVGAR